MCLCAQIRLLADATWQTISEPPSKRSKTGPSRSESEADRDDTPPPPGLGIPGAAERANAISALAAQLEAESQQPTARGTADDPLVLD